MMPVMDGYEFRREQKQDPRLTQIPILVTTASADIEAKRVQIGANAFFRKPLDIDEILKTVERFAA